MTNYLRRIEALEARHNPAASLPVVVVFANDGDDGDAIVVAALRERGLQSGEAQVMVVRWDEPRSPAVKAKESARLWGLPAHPRHPVNSH